VAKKPDRKAIAKRGRPSDYTPEVALTICERLGGGDSRRTICLDETMPAQSTVFLWLAAHEDFSEHYARAREAQADGYAEEIITIADGATPTADGIKHAEIRIESRKWYAGKVRPKVYGEQKQPGVQLNQQFNNYADDYERLNRDE
jgi:hypothetical protein